MTRKTILSATLALTLISCSGSRFQYSDKMPDTVIRIETDSISNTGYIGNGAQWDPYSLDYGKGHVDISQSDWEKIYARLDYMKPGFIRMMQNTVDRVKDGQLDPTIGLEHLTHLLDYCQSRDIAVIFGDWGGWMVDAGAKTINRQLIAQAAEYVRFLVKEKGYTCIRYYNLINEPNGDWSVTNRDFDLWSDAMLILGKEFKDKGISEDVTIIGPDAAIWTEDEAWWVSRTAEKLGDIVGLYDIHTYPSKTTINSGRYSEIISAYKAQVPEGYKIVMGEIGIKYVDPADSLLNRENIRRAMECSHASKTDSQMSVYDHSYGTDMADALFQTINAGYSGSIVWMLDDAMHTHETKERLKIWGFWNILGEEIFGEEEEKVRPWFYAWSLLCRYIPAGSDFNPVEVISEDGSYSPVKAVSVINGGRRTIAAVNVSDRLHTVSLSCSSIGKIRNARVYIFGEGLYRTEGDCTMLPEMEDVNIDLSGDKAIDIPAGSMVVITDME